MAVIPRFRRRARQEAAREGTALRLSPEAARRINEAGRPAPEFHPAPCSAPPTAPMAVIPGDAEAPVEAPVPPAAGAADVNLLGRVLDGMKTKWRAESFIADKRELPCFNATTRAVGWQGLHMPPQPAVWQRWSTDPWLANEMALTDAAFRSARALVHGELNEIRARVDGALAPFGGAR